MGISDLNKYNTKNTLVKLPTPFFNKTVDIYQVFANRKTTRNISDKELTLQMLSNLLWAACGVNRGDFHMGGKGRTSATASNSQEIDIYITLEEGVYKFDSFEHALVPILSEDLRLLAIGAPQSKVDTGVNAPVRLLYVANVDKLTNTTGHKEPGLTDADIQKAYYHVDTGMIASNVYLFAAAHNLASWFHNCNKTALMEKLKLGENQRILFGHTVGYPA